MSVMRYDWSDDGMWEHEGCGKYVPAIDYDALLLHLTQIKESVEQAAYMLSDAQSGFITGTGSDAAWCKSRDALVATLRAAVSNTEKQP